MPGFTNYNPSETGDQNQRKLQIEEFDINNLHKIDVSLPSSTDIIK
jgi:hypothetical protein